MSNTAIKIENLSKQYRLGLVGSGTLKDDLKRWWYRSRGKADPTLKIGEENRLDTTSGKYIWALKDINLEVQEGEVLGIIGKNGAGKSTLLKILSKVTGPTTGIIKTKGKIASLLEVGTGMHPELTGRENVFLNGAILGMNKNEIRKKFDEIIDFAGVVRYIDTPVKRYSSGMHVRLGFAVAAFLEPEILIVDEVLAVGDAEFQRKAIGKMQDVSHSYGRTVLFVSHNMGSVKSLCQNAILLRNGQIETVGDVGSVVESYQSFSHLDIPGQSYSEKNDLRLHPNKNGDPELGMIEISLFCDDKPTDHMYPGCKLEFWVKYLDADKSDRMRFGFVIKDEQNNELVGLNNENLGYKMDNSLKKGIIKTSIPKLPLYIGGNYYIDLYLGDGFRDYDVIENAAKFYLEKNSAFFPGTPPPERFNKLFISDVEIKRYFE